jgi:hypothetical protein
MQALRVNSGTTTKNFQAGLWHSGIALSTRVMSRRNHGESLLCRVLHGCSAASLVEFWNRTDEILLRSRQMAGICSSIRAGVLPYIWKILFDF